MKDIIVGMDLGGTSLRALVVDGRNKILGVGKTPTKVRLPQKALIAEIAEFVREVVADAGVSWSRIRAVSIGAPAAVDPVRGIVHHAPNLNWYGVPLGPQLKALLRVPVFVENDVNVGTVGEHVLGAGKGRKCMVGIFVGTGIGGGVILDGRLHEGCRGSAGEVGHIVLQANGPRCGCGRRGCAEGIASRTAMERDVRLAIKAGKRSLVLKMMKERGRPRMTSSVIQRALRKKDPVMVAVMRNAQFYLGLLVAAVVNLLDPECVVVGGGIAERLGEEFVLPIRKTAQKYYLNREHVERIRVVPGALGDNAGPLGAVVLARRRLS